MAEKGKTILVLGNGFDIAHGLPTRYSDFLEFCDRIENIYSFRSEGSRENEYRAICLSNWEMNNEIKEKLFEAFCKREVKTKYNPDSYFNEVTVLSTDKYIQEIHSCLQENVWYNYLGELHRQKKCVV